MNRQLILASTSKYRKELLARLGVPFISVGPQVDESLYKDKGMPAVELAESLAILKAEDVFKSHSSACVIGSDQVAEINGTILGKPHTREKAFEQLKQMNGMEHALVTSICVLYADCRFVYTDRTFLRMRHLTDDQLYRYIDYDSPLDCAGSYKLESRGISLFRKIEGIDHTAIQGLPLMKVAEILSQIGFDLP